MLSLQSSIINYANRKMKTIEDVKSRVDHSIDRVPRDHYSVMLIDDEPYNKVEYLRNIGYRDIEYNDEFTNVSNYEKYERVSRSLCMFIAL